mmetsp:Transcript_14424/g.45099  ORF Transcript_14424/g.45099 Transcript_14424/m.45099 type:complete len:504 (-) Transcript_14424:76-1587(-)
MPVKDVAARIEVVSRDEARRVGNIMKNIPQHTLFARRRCDHLHLQRGLRHRHLSRVRPQTRGAYHRRLDGSLHDAREAARLRDGHVNPQKTRPGPQHVGKSEVDVQHPGHGRVLGHEARLAVDDAVATHAVKHRVVEHQGHASLVDRTAAVRPRVAAPRGIDLGGVQRGPGRVPIQVVGGAHKVHLARALLRLRNAAPQPAGGVHKCLLHRGGVQNLPAVRLGHGGCQQGDGARHDGAGDASAAQRAAAALDLGSRHVAAVGDHVRLEASRPVRQLLGGHAAAGEGGNAVRIVDAAHADDVHHVRGVVERAVQRPVVANGRHHDDAVGGHLVHFLHERDVQVVGPADAQVDDVNFGGDGVVERVQEPRRVRHLVVGEDAEGVDVGVGREAMAHVVLARDHTHHEGAVAQTVVERGLVCPVGALLDAAEVRMVRAHAGVKDARLDAVAAVALFPQRRRTHSACERRRLATLQQAAPPRHSLVGRARAAVVLLVAVLAGLHRPAR